MIKMKYSEITNGQLLQTLHKIGNAPINSVETFKIRKIAKITKALTKYSTEVSNRFQNDILPHYAVKRPDGSYIDRESERGKPFEILKEKEAEYKRAIEEFNEHEIELLDSHKDPIVALNWKDIAHANVKPVEINYLGELFNEESLADALEETEDGPGIPKEAAFGAPLKSV